MSLKTIATIMLIVIVFAIIIAVTSNNNKRMEDSKIIDCGVKKIAENLYLKKLDINRDHVYLLVDKDGNLVSTDVNSNFTIGKTRQTATFIGTNTLESTK